MCECLAASPERLSLLRLAYAAPYSLFFAAKQGLEDVCAAAGDAVRTAFEPASASVSAGRTAFVLDFAPVRRGVFGMRPYGRRNFTKPYSGDQSVFFRLAQRGCRHSVDDSPMFCFSVPK